MDRKEGGWNFTHLAWTSVKWLDYQPYGWDSNQVNRARKFDRGRIIQFLTMILNPQMNKSNGVQKENVHRKVPQNEFSRRGG